MRTWIEKLSRGWNSLCMETLKFSYSESVTYIWNKRMPWNISIFQKILRVNHTVQSSAIEWFLAQVEKILFSLNLLLNLTYYYYYYYYNIYIKGEFNLLTQCIFFSAGLSALKASLNQCFVLYSNIKYQIIFRNFRNFKEFFSRAPALKAWIQLKNLIKLFSIKFKKTCDLPRRLSTDIWYQIRYNQIYQNITFLLLRLRLTLC